jgi:D-alanyl-D-alanine dipeptidase
VLAAAALAVALAATSTVPQEPARAGLVDAAALVPDAVLDVRYATADNLAGRPLYPVAGSAT